MASSPFSSLSPTDAVAALRSFPRRFDDASRAAAAAIDDDDPDQSEIDEFAARTGSDGWSALHHIAGATARLEAVTPELRAALVSPDRRIEDALIDPTPSEEPPPHSGSLPTELARLERAAAGLADELDRADGDRWLGTRPTGGGSTATPLDVLRAAVEHSLDRLRGVEAVLREVRGRP